MPRLVFFQVSVHICKIKVVGIWCVHVFIPVHPPGYETVQLFDGISVWIIMLMTKHQNMKCLCCCD
jgi:hypothetical protein